MHRLHYTVPLISHYAGFFSLANSYFRYRRKMARVYCCLTEKRPKE